MKIKILNLLPRRKKLRAATARRGFGAPVDLEYEEMSEPNMKLSRALLIVLVLHIVAVAGIIAFNSIKTRQGFPAAPVAKAKATPAPAINNSNANEFASTTGPTAPGRPALPLTSANASAEKKPLRAKPIESGKTYTVVKGDTPVTIARKFKVSADELLALNHLEDPKKLKIGQKLNLPAKAKAAKKADG